MFVRKTTVRVNFTLREIRIDFIPFLLERGQVLLHIVTTVCESEIFHLCLLRGVVHYELRADRLKNHFEFNQAARNTPARDLVCVSKQSRSGVQRVVTRALEMIFENHVNDARVLTQKDATPVDEAKITRFIGIDGPDNHVVLTGNGQG